MTPGLLNATAPFSDLLAEPVRNGVYKPKEHRGHGIKMVNMGQLFAFNFISGQEMERIELSDRELAKDTLRDGDLLFARRSLVLEGSGKCSLIVSPPEPTTFESSMIRARLDSTRADPLYYFYFFHSPTGRALMASIASRTAVSGIRGSDLVTLKVFRPPLPMQKKVASILSAYDDLIENNTRRIAILEEMAQSLYREWFVNFRFPGHQDARMAESEFGPIPMRWRIDRLGELAGVNASSRRPQQAPAEIAYVDISSLRVGRIEKVERLRFEEAPGRARRKVQHGDIIWSNVRPNRRSHALILEPPPDLVASTGFTVISAMRVPWSYLYQFVTTDEFVGYLTNHATGAAYPAVTARDFENAAIVVPTEEMMQRYHYFAEPLYAEREVLLRKNHVLRQTRDLLLPKLVSGQIDVSDLDIRIPEAVE